MLSEQFKILTQFMILSYEMRKNRKEECEHSLTFFRLVYFYHEFRWIRDCISQNAYHQAIRELRFILDSMVQAYYIDKEHPSTKMQCKLEIVKELDRHYRGQLIEPTGLEHKETLKELYGELSGYVHSSYKELSALQSRSPRELESLKFEQDPEMEKICEAFLNRAMDAVFFVALSLFPDISRPPKRLENLGNSFRQSSRKLELKLTLSKWPRLS